MRRHAKPQRLARTVLPVLALAAVAVAGAGVAPGLPLGHRPGPASVSRGVVFGGAPRPDCSGSQLDPNGHCAG
jgi:hypothetical protein